MGQPTGGHGSVVYRVDPRLFHDGDNDGVGDIVGLIANIGYLRWLGVDGLWLAPLLPLPEVRETPLLPRDALLPDAMAPEGVELLVREAHRCGLRVLLDAGGSLHRAPATPTTSPRKKVAPRKAVAGMAGAWTVASTSPARRWLDAGVDAVWTGGSWEIGSNLGGTIHPGSALLGCLGQPRVLLADDERPRSRPVCSTCADPAHCAHLPPAPAPARWNPRELVAAISDDRPSPALPPLWMFSSPAAPRLSSRLGGASARLAATLLLTLPGSVAICSGDEVGVVDGPAHAQLGGVGGHTARLERAAMPWDGGPGTGFAADPWRPLIGARTDPVARQQQDPDSLLGLYRRLIALRRTEPALIDGALSPVRAEGGVLVYLRHGGGNRFLVAANGGREPAEVPFHAPLSGHVALASDRTREGARLARSFVLQPHEAVIIRLGG